MAVRTDDPITTESVAAYLGNCALPVKPAPPHLPEQADVLLIMVGEVTSETMDWMRTAREQRGHGARVVLVASSLTESQLVRAVSYGLTSFLHRRTSTMAQVLQAVVNSRNGRAELPQSLIASLVELLHSTRDSALSSNGLSQREVDVVRHLAEGLDTLEIAARLNYSERTIKAIIHSAINRLGLRNRAHVVAYALRKGLV
ncbi:response regulator transcription factor [Streptomyces sp. NBC_01476]|uniref:helix-turn-helix transcriptional regulator n=1 Tax=Streptomyces sp. NBC_01476 TaxID=2903881 RepID=UPI002E301D35|nr:response regulator transcription factor [Streptomyces sp. NBC_01476]